MMDFKFKNKKNVKAIAAKFHTTQRKAKEALGEANKAGAALIWREAWRRTPKRRGDLEASGKIIPAGPALKHLIAFDTDYAMLVHDWDKNAPLGKASRKKQAAEGVKVGFKYLQRGYDENKKAILKKVEDKLRGLLGGTTN